MTYSLQKLHGWNKNCKEGLTLFQSLLLALSVRQLTAKSSYPHRRGRGQSVHFRLLKFIGCVQWHALMINTLTISLCINCVAGKEGVGLCWRPYTAELLHSVWDQIQCLIIQRQKLRRGGGLRKINSRRKILFQVIFKTKRFCIVFYESYPSTDTSFPSLVSFLLSVESLPRICLQVARSRGG